MSELINSVEDEIKRIDRPGPRNNMDRGGAIRGTKTKWNRRLERAKNTGPLSISNNTASGGVENRGHAFAAEIRYTDLPTLRSICDLRLSATGASRSSDRPAGLFLRGKL